MGSIIVQRIDYNGVGALRRQRPIPGKIYPSIPPGCLHYSRPSHLVQDPHLVKVNELPSSFFIIQSPEMLYFWLKSFNFNDVIIREISCFGELSLVPRGHSWSLVCTFKYNRVQHLHEQTAFLAIIFKTLGLIRLTRILSYTNQARKQQIPKLSPVQTA